MIDIYSVYIIKHDFSIIIIIIKGKKRKKKPHGKRKKMTSDKIGGRDTHALHLAICTYKYIVCTYLRHLNYMIAGFCFYSAHQEYKHH